MAIRETCRGRNSVQPALRRLLCCAAQLFHSKGPRLDLHLRQRQRATASDKKEKTCDCLRASFDVLKGENL